MAAATPIFAGANAAMGVLGMIEGKRQTDKAADANQAERERALRFQRRMRKRALRQINKMQKGATEKILASSKRAKGDALTALATGGWDTGSGQSLAMRRAGQRDEANALTNLASAMAGQRTAVYSGQEFPMIQYDTGAGARMAEQGWGMLGSGLAGLVGSLGQPKMTADQGLEALKGGLQGTAKAFASGLPDYWNPYK
tara:strand:+ start:6280 stop:6876 length:597 start_codon:yes stop_codon:yes gene_type:complete